MSKQLTPAALVALKDALTHIYWFKKDLKSFLLNSLPENIQISHINWELTKREIITAIVDKLAQKQHTQILLQLAENICQFNTFEHLAHLEDSENKIRLAKNAVNHLKQFMIPYQEIQQEEVLRKQRKKQLKKNRNHLKVTRKNYVL
ncbi:hypothetical protein L0F67_10030 [Actinobacillus suis]|uniref:hypothetical protein n=1 Tax=Actinobacillus suis TaxID=716 RepID=UPI00207D62EA|nr:hypothetical protein [Actinobacillus suis]MCO4166760.1 hypothetical protein [Actinobacillus suis]UTH25151.1 hypothetical protein L0F67_10030 [Actinobacillus suis]